MSEERTDHGIGAGIAMVPGSRTSCILITVLTVMLAGFAGHPTIDPVLRTLYFAALFASFHGIRRREPALDTAAYRLLELGFLVLTLGLSAAAVFRLTGVESESRVCNVLSQSFERGAVYLVGISLITYGILLFLPSLVESYQILRARFAAAEHENQRMEKRMIEADRYRALGELAAGVAHDLRNPLTIVKTAAESLHRRSRSPEEIEEHCRVISRNVEKAERTIAALLDLGKPRTLAPRLQDISDLTAELVTLVRPEARRLKVGLHRPEAPPLLVHTDHKLLGQALLNVILNALQATAPGGHVTVRTRRFRRGERDLAAIVVEDRGSGLRPGDRENLFTPFFTTKESGTGLGLLSCRRILDELGGGIDLFPRLRGGARAVLLVPCGTAKAMADPIATDATTRRLREVTA